MENGVADDHQFSDEEGYVENVPDAELVPDVLEQRPTENDTTDNIIIIDGVPIVGQDRVDKLRTFLLKKILDKLGKLVEHYIPTDEDGQTCGYMFLQFETAKMAEEAVAVLNGYKMDKQHTFIVNKFSDLEKYKEVSDTWEKPTPRPYKDHGDLTAWLQNSDCLDQFAVLYEDGEKAAVFLNTAGEPMVLQEKQRWTETTVRWSPQGTFMATFHEKGVAIWGGEKFEQINRYPHQNVSCIDFSPCERYLVTYSIPRNRYMEPVDAIRIWNVRTGEMKRAFPGGDSSVKTWPYFKWSCGDEYFAVTKGESIYIYEMPSCQLLDKKSVRIEGLKGFEWSPSQPMIAYWLAEREQIPARVGLMQIPEKVDVRSKNLFNVAEARIYFQKQGYYLCMKVNRYSRKKQDKDGEVQYSGITHNLELFHLKKKEIPNDTVEIKNPIRAFAWDPCSSKFIVIAGEIRHSIFIYSAKSPGAPLKTIEAKTHLNAIFWAPSGVYCLIAGLRLQPGQMAGPLMFLDTNELSVIHNQEHTGLTDVEWDPTGRYVTTCVSSINGKGDFGYMMWNFQGQLRVRRPMDRFVSLSWRPRPPSLLTDFQKREIKRNIKKYTARFEERDRQSQSKTSKEILERRRALKDDFSDWKDERFRDYDDFIDERDDLRDMENEALADADMDEETIEFLVREDNEIVKQE
jgi:translation initiation factor 3 subunit B